MIQPIKKSIIISLTFVFLLASVSLACGGSTTPLPPASPEEYAFIACRMFIEDQLGLLAGDAQEYNSSRVTALPDDLYEVNVLYAKYSSTYRCVVQHSGENWKLISLELK